MKLPANITRAHIISAIEEIDNTGRKDRSSFKFDLVYEGKTYPPLLVVALANKYANGEELPANISKGGWDSEEFKLLEKYGFQITEKTTDSKKVMVYEIKKSADQNSDQLFNKEKTYFYWNQDKFVNLNIGDLVFIINTHSRYVLFTELNKTNIDVSYSESEDKTFFEDNKGKYYVSGKWGVFIRLKIILFKSFTNWDWKSLGAGEITYFLGDKVSKQSAHNNLDRINQLEVLFESNDEVLDLLKQCELRVINMDESYYSELIKFLQQAKTNDLHVTQYVKIFMGLSVKVSFGQGNPARIPWISFLGARQQTSNGIYPVYLYYKDINVLILAFGLSEENKPNIEWQNIDNPPTIKDFLESKHNHSPKRYGDSFVFKYYPLDEQLNRKEVDEDLLQIIKKYKENLPVSPIINDNKIVDKKIMIKEVIDHSYKYINSLGFKYLYEEIANFYLSLRTKPFVILAGISGTGKTQLPRKFAESLGFSENQLIQVPVSPAWTDGSDLLGYTSLDGYFIPKDLTLAIIKASEHPEKPYFFILDEMNLARVEHYFSDFLSIIETRKWKGDDIVTDSILRKEILNEAKNKENYQSLSWPQNLYLIGTVNMDETTHAFSRKVLDRANSIEMNEIDLSWTQLSKEKPEPLSSITNEKFKTEFLISAEISAEEKDSISDEMDRLKRVNDILQKADLHFAYRVRDEIAFYLVLNTKYNLLDADIAFDFQIVQKVLPRIHGSSERVQIVLIELLNELEGKNYSANNFDVSDLGDFPITDSKYRRATKKIIFMLKRFNDDRFTSFWI